MPSCTSIIRVDGWVAALCAKKASPLHMSEDIELAMAVSAHLIRMRHHTLMRTRLVRVWGVLRVWDGLPLDIRREIMFAAIRIGRM